jgi:DNA polymerase-1
MTKSDLLKQIAEYEGPGIVPDQVPGRVLILDGDGLCYDAAYTVDTIEAGILHIQSAVASLMRMTGCTSARVHLTAKDSKKAGRLEIRAYKPYQAHRKGKPKPPLLEPLREAITGLQTASTAVSYHLHHDVEADDAIVMDSERLGQQGLVASVDKDLRQVRGPYLDMSTFEIDNGAGPGWLKLVRTSAGAWKLIGRGMVFFWAQMLMGDAADNIQGLAPAPGKTRACGPAKAFKLLEEANEADAARIVLECYREIGQDPLPEAQLLYLLRHPDDNVLEYLNGLDLPPELKRYLEDCRAGEPHDAAS